MGLPVLIIGKSGSGKSTSLRNFKSGEVGIINVLGKYLPFRNDLKTVATDEYSTVMSTLFSAKANTLVIDDAGYLMTNQFMKGHASTGKGNAIFDFFNTIGDNFWNLILFIKTKLPAEKIVYIIMHEEQSEFGSVSPKTIGKMLDDKVCVEGMFEILLRCKAHKFYTQVTENDVAKTPIDMFADIEIDNDLKMVDKTIREYYKI